MRARDWIDPNLWRAQLSHVDGETTVVEALLEGRYLTGRRARDDPSVHVPAWRPGVPQ